MVVAWPFPNQDLRGQAAAPAPTPSTETTTPAPNPWAPQGSQAPPTSSASSATPQAPGLGAALGQGGGMFTSPGMQSLMGQMRWLIFDFNVPLLNAFFSGTTLLSCPKWCRRHTCRAFSEDCKTTLTRLTSLWSGSDGFNYFFHVAGGCHPFQQPHVCWQPCLATADVRYDASTAAANAEPANSAADEQPGSIGSNHADPAGHGPPESRGSRSLPIDGPSIPAP